MAGLILFVLGRFIFAMCTSRANQVAQVMLEHAAALVGMTMHCTEVHAFHYKVIQEVIVVMSKAWLRCWYVAKCAMEGEGCSRVHALL